MIPTIVTLHHPITRDRALEMAHTDDRRKRRSIGRWYCFVKMQGRVAARMPRIVVVSENSIKDIHADMGVSLDRMRLVPVGVDPELFQPLPHVARQPGRLITTASADVALKGLAYLLEAMAKLRTERDVTPDDHRQAARGRQQRPDRQARPAPAHRLRQSGVTDERIVELYAEAELAVVPEPVRGLQPPGDRGDEHRHLPRRHRRRRAARGHRRATARPCCRRKAGDVESLSPRSAAASTTPALRARIGAAGRQRVVERWSWTHCAAAHRRPVPRGAGDAGQRRQAAPQRHGPTSTGG